MKNYRFQSVIALALLIEVTCSCQKEKNFNPNNHDITSSPGVTSMIVLGNQLQNPYSIQNMVKAQNNLKLSNRSREGIDDIEISTTHLYVKFLPRNDEELSILKRDTSLILFTYPMDYEIAKEGDYYHDPSVPQNQPTYQYASIKSNKKLNYGVAYEVLAELFIPDEEESGAASSRAASTTVVDELVNEALFITGNLKDSSSENSTTRNNARASNAKKSEWRPAGRITVWENVVNDYVGVVDVEVRAKRWFTVHKGTTNAQGFYSCDGTFKREADYSLIWEKYHFSIRTGTFGQAEVGQSNSNADWNPQFGSRGSTNVNDGQQYYALIFQGARDYYYGNRFGLSSPPRNSALHPQVKISADFQGKSASKASHAAMYTRTLGILPSLYVRRWNDPSDRVYAVTIHELAHAAHWDMDRDAFRTLVILFGVLGAESSEAVVESWANGVEWQFAVERYRNLYGRIGYQYDGGYQAQTINSDPLYTSIVVDMIDNNNQREFWGGNVIFPLDRVSGYSILQIEQGLRGAVSWNAWRNNMKSLHDNPTENNVDELYANWY